MEADNPLNRDNNEFWSELCGSHLAKVLGIEDDTEASLKKFDDWYMDYYPYLVSHLPSGDLTGKRVLEIGLGYGTVSSVLMKMGAEYTGVDVAAGPVSMNQHRANLLGAIATSKQASACELPFDDETFDHVVSIGCLHHTGNLPLALQEVQRVLKPGGELHVMVYNALSYRQWLGKPFETTRRAFADPSEPDLASIDDVRYDANEDGEAAPETVYVKKSELALMLDQCSDIRIVSENVAAINPLNWAWVRRLSNWTFGSSVGLDLYTTARKR